MYQYIANYNWLTEEKKVLIKCFIDLKGRCGGLIVIVLNSGSIMLWMLPSKLQINKMLSSWKLDRAGWEFWVLFFDKTLQTHSASLHPGELAGDNPAVN